MNRSPLVLLALALALPALPAAAKEKSGPKKRIAVLDFEDKSGDSGHYGNIGQGMADMLTTALFKTGKFIVIERSQIEKVMEEQKFDATGAVQAGTAAKLGQAIGVGMIVTGSVTEFGIKESKAGVGNLGRVFGVDGGGSVQSQQARCAVDVRFIDTSSGQILAAEKAEGSSTSRKISADVDGAPSMEFGKEGWDSTTLGKATREAVENVVELIEKNLENVAWYGRIVKVSGSRILVNTGEDDGRKPGDTFLVERLGEDLKDPDTGESLGSETTKIGRIKIVEVKGKKLAAAEAVDGSGFQDGDTIKEAK